MKFIIKKITRKTSDVICRFLIPKNLKPITYNLKPYRGFTLVETLVAISILMVAVASPLTISQKGLASAIYAKDQIIASYLAQDAIEYLRNWSDQNVASGAGWLDGITNKCASSCAVDTRQLYLSENGIQTCPGSGCQLLKFGADNIYAYSVGGNDSPFTRSVTVTPSLTQPNIEALITVTMSWKDKSKDRNLVINTRIFNWR
ncbi:MAG: prepilin-type N-terminal cleavage/methylation domain-containing protein [Patescibacteria group bacterium]|nr:prepilin-type N-terminal cleavage/methylation domain-containing protein [Patescibacteria group bacterium]MDE2218251.1 prepilin-type N-terminal cleavage/methylation domain-containing protein [Patescibacteria group bacterium]